MTSADFCPITPGIAPRRAACAWLLAALFARTGWQHSPCAQACSTSGLTGRLLRHAPHSHVGQISPDKNVNCCYTSAAFTLSPEPGASLSCANLPGDWALYAVSVPRIRSGAGLFRSVALRLPSDTASRRRPCLQLVLMLTVSTINRIHVQGTFTP